MIKKILLLGSGELGKELVIAAQRIGQHVIAVDSYKDAPAMHVADEFEVIDMLDGTALDAIVARHQPDLIVPEIEAIRTERFYDYEKQGIQVVPSAKAANYTMDRKAIRDLAAIDLSVRTAPYKYAKNIEALTAAVAFIGMPCVVKPLMSSSGKGQSVIKTEEDIAKAWDIATNKGRGDKEEVIVEGFIDFHTEITLLTVTQKNGPTLYCPAIGHRQERGDYQESWQPVHLSDDDLKTAQEMADKVTKALTGAGLWGVEFFITNNGVVFSELSPRPHDTGMVTLAGTQNFSEFELHLRAILGIPIQEITLERSGASAVILFEEDIEKVPLYDGLDKAAQYEKSDFRVFGKPITRQYRRMGLGLAYEAKDQDPKISVERAKKVAECIKVI
jgi:phosphoribosylglycinamide formyltransferase 2